MITGLAHSTLIFCGAFDGARTYGSDCQACQVLDTLIDIYSLTSRGEEAKGLLKSVGRVMFCDLIQWAGNSSENSFNACR